MSTLGIINDFVCFAYRRSDEAMLFQLYNPFQGRVTIEDELHMY